ncbi:hypothetical protein EHM92_02400 [bacterium]|nr:MAG: hypothetical protein EHM92_02400 [bacterium]
MSEQHVTEHLSAYMSGDLDESLSRLVREHLAACDACSREFNALRGIWDGLGRLPEEQPGEALSKGFYDMLNGYEQAVRHSESLAARMRGGRAMVLSWLSSPAFQVGFAVVMLGVGLFFGRFLGGGNTNSQEMAQLRDEVRQLGNLLTVSLLQQESASERLKGVSWSQRVDGDDAEIIDALIRTMKYDRNVNVRLAALDVLARYANRPRVHQEIVRAFPAQASPLMQVALVDLLVQINDAESRAALQQALKTPDLNPVVQKRIKQGIQVML